MATFLSILLLVTEAIISIWLLTEILQLADFLPQKGKYSFALFPVKRQHLLTVAPDTILNEIRNRHVSTQPETPTPDEEVLRLINRPGVLHKQQSQFFTSINTYLIRTHFVQPDVQLIAAMTERHIRFADHLLRFMLFVPFAIGILAFITSGASYSSFGPWVLLIGIIFTTVLGILFVRQRRMLEERSIDFEHFLLAGLTVTVGTNFTDTIQHLRTELHSFSHSLATRITDLSKAHDEQLAKINTINETQVTAINNQTKLLEEIRKMDFPQITRFNTEVLTSMKETTSSFGMFTQLANSLGGLLQSMDSVATSLNKGLERTSQIEQIALEVRETVRRNNLIQEVMIKHIDTFNTRTEYLKNTVGAVDLELTKTLSELRDHLQVQVNAIKQIVLRDNEVIESAVKTGNLRFEKLDKIEDLVKIFNTLYGQFDYMLRQQNELNEKQQLQYEELVKIRSVAEQKRKLF